VCHSYGSVKKLNVLVYHFYGDWYGTPIEGF
jgi:hypothetical protein